MRTFKCMLSKVNEDSEVTKSLTDLTVSEDWCKKNHGDFDCR